MLRQPRSLRSENADSQREFDEQGNEICFYVGLNDEVLPGISRYPDPKGYAEYLLACYINYGTPSKHYEIVERYNPHNILVLSDEHMSEPSGDAL